MFSVSLHERWPTRGSQEACGSLPGFMRLFAWFHAALCLISCGSLPGFMRLFAWFHAALRLVSCGSLPGFMRLLPSSGILYFLNVVTLFTFNEVFLHERKGWVMLTCSHEFDVAPSPSLVGRLCSKRLHIRQLPLNLKLHYSLFLFATAVQFHYLLLVYPSSHLS